MKTILVIDDDPEQGLLYEQDLSDAGYRVLRAMNGCQGLEMAREQRPDCVVLDINMPDIDGLEVLSRILAAQPQLPVILNTAYSGYQDNFMSWAADSYVVKSSNLAELKSHIEAAIAHAATAATAEKAVV
jgi:DNA-binding response OmpR family regulator